MIRQLIFFINKYYLIGALNQHLVAINLYGLTPVYILERMRAVKKHIKGKSDK